MPNERNEKYLAFNFERIRYWLGQGADLSRPVAEILGKCITSTLTKTMPFFFENKIYSFLGSFATGSAGFLPIHPRQYMMAWRLRAKEEVAQKERDAAAASKEQAESNTSDS